MSEIKIEFTVEADDDGYVSFECPYCKSIFGLKVSEVQDDNSTYEELFCPYCGLNDKTSNFYTKEVAEQIKNLTINYIQDELNKAFKKMTRRVNNRYVKLTYKPPKNLSVKDIRTITGVEEVFKCKHCSNHVKIDLASGKAKAYCAFCGIDI